MFGLTNFCTFEKMDGAIVHSVSSQNDLHPAEHAITPIEPNFAWETNAENEYHQLIIDLTENRAIDGVMFIHHEAEEIIISVSYSNNAINWTNVWLTGIPWGETTNELSQLKIRYLWDATNSEALTINARYWRITFYGAVSPNYYPPVDMRVSACWLFTKYAFNQRAALSIDEQVAYPKNTQILPFGKQFTTGYNVNPTIDTTRTWLLTDAQRTILQHVISESCQVGLPFILLEFDLPIIGSEPVAYRKLFKFQDTPIIESVIDIGLTQVTVQLVQIPIVKSDARH